MGMRKITIVVLILAVSLIFVGGVLAGIGASKGGAVKLYWDMDERQVVPYEREGKVLLKIACDGRSDGLKLK